MSETSAPRVIVLAGPNGVGKSTTASEILRGPFHVQEFVNADVIAQGLSGFAPENVAWQAGRLMLSRINQLATARVDFAFETTLASRTFATWLRHLIFDGYEFHLVFLWLPSADLAVCRVKDRVERGGHNVPEETIRRRYTAGVRNFLEIYNQLATSWQVVDNSGSYPKLIAYARPPAPPTVIHSALWDQFVASAER